MKYFIYSFYLVTSLILLSSLNLFNSKLVIKNAEVSETSVLKTVDALISQGQLRLSLYESNALANNESAADGLLIFFDTEGNNTIDENDALDIPNLDENFSVNNNGILLSIESRATPINDEELQLEVNTYRNTEYNIVAEGIFMQCATAFLYDVYTDVFTEIPQNGTVNYSYSVNPGISSSVANNRFKIIFEVEDSQLTWNGSVSNDWNDSNNWTPNEVPGICSEVTIPLTENPPQMSSDMTIATIAINPGSNLRIPLGETLNVTGDLNMYSQSYSYSGLIVNGAISVAGNTKYHRYTNSELNNRDLIAPPLAGQSWTSFLTNDNNHNANILYNNGAVPPNTSYLFGPFEKGAIDDYLVYNYNTVETLSSGRGYRVATNMPIEDGNGEALVFTGSLVTGSVNVPIWNDVTGSFPEWNLIGNPYASYIDVNVFLNHVGSVSGVSNLSLLDENTAAIYGYDANDTDGSNWTITNFIEGPALIAPGQGFFVSSNLSFANLEFTPDMQVESKSDDFIIGRTLSNLDFVKIKMNTSLDSSITSIYFHEDASLGLDVGYDAAVFGGNTLGFALYSHLVQDNVGTPMAIQTLHSGDILDVVIPLGVNANPGEEIRFSIEEITLPATTNVYLEDTVANTSTLLTNSDYIILSTAFISGTGRFFLRVNEDALLTINNDLETLDIFLLNSLNELVIRGQLQENTKLALYDIHGREILSFNLDVFVYEHRINLSSLNEGIYIATIQNKIWSKSKKIIIE